MKNLFYNLLFLLLIVVSERITAQSDICGQQPKWITTNPSAPNNPECPYMLNSPSNSNPWFNYMNWMDSQFPVNFLPTGYITNPFYNSTNGYFGYLWDNSVSYAPDFYPEEGWELIKAQTNQNNSLMAYMILYNRHTSVIRVLATKDRKQDSQKILIKLMFNSQTNGTGLFSPQFKIANPMDKPSLRSSSVPVTNPNDESLFYGADFQVEYDPCTCMSEIPISMSVEFQTIRNCDLSMYERSVSVSTPLLNVASGLSTIPDPNFIGAVFENDLTHLSKSAGNYVFSSWRQAQDHIQTLMAQNQPFQDISSAFSNFESAMDGLNQLVGPATTLLGLSSGGATELIEQSSKEIGKYFKTLNAPIKSKIEDNQKIIDKLGAMSFMTTEAGFKGNITEIEPAGSIEFTLPGTARCNPNNLSAPVYNEVLGRFTLMHTPQMSTWHDLSTDKNVFKVDAMPEYKFNPAAFVDKQHTSILAAVVLHTTSGSCREKHGLDLIDVDDIGNEIYISKFVPINCIDNLVFGFNSTSINNPGNINCGLDMPLEVLSAEIRLIITYQFLTSDHNGVPNRTIQIATYPLKVNSLSSRYNNNPQIISPFYDFPQHLHVGSLSPIGQYAMIGNTIFAWDDITISGNLSLPSGFSSIDLVAPRVTILPGASLGAGITFHERKMPVDCGEAHEWSGDLSSFCHSDDYKAKYLIPEKSRATSNQSVNSISEDNLAAFPNPAKDNINFSFDLKEKGTVNLYITDMMGQPVGRILSNENLNIGQYKYDYNLSGLNAGIYICILECPEGKRISKFEIIR